jgi:hypothetical protein
MIDSTTLYNYKSMNTAKFLDLRTVSPGLVDGQPHHHSVEGALGIIMAKLERQGGMRDCLAEARKLEPLTLSDEEIEVSLV